MAVMFPSEMMEMTLSSSSSSSADADEAAELAAMAASWALARHRVSVQVGKLLDLLDLQRREEIVCALAHATLFFL